MSAWRRRAERWDFLADGSAPVLTGHENGLITINLAEADDSERERRRHQMGEPYRTLLGHFRHEIAHYYWSRLVANSPLLEQFRQIFGDERRVRANHLRLIRGWRWQWARHIDPIERYETPPLPGALCVIGHAESFWVHDASGQTIGSFYFRDHQETARHAGVLKRDEARRMAANFARLPELFDKADGDWTMDSPAVAAVVIGGLRLRKTEFALPSASSTLRSAPIEGLHTCLRSGSEPGADLERAIDTPGPGSARSEASASME
jgi:putative zinc-binding metallo-peptidase